LSGSILKKRREELGLDLKDISALLKIKREFLSAIEDDLFDRLPARVYTVGYIRNYSDYLKVDPADIIKLYSKQLPPPKTAAPIMPVILDKDRRKPKTLYIAATLLALAAGLIIYMKIPHTTKEGKQAEVRVEATRNRETINSRDEKKEAGTIMNTARTEERTTDTPKVQAQKGTKPEPPAAVYSGITDSISSTGDQALHTLSIKAVDMSWIYVKFRNGKHEEVTMQPGQTREWSFHNGASLKTGNAGGIQVVLDGKDLGPVGTKGQVVVLTFPPAADPAY
jgi:cytoskeletal protein RodZ